MAYRFTNTEKWNDAWFSNLKPLEKLLFIYLCDNCDIAGFIELNTKRWSIDINISKAETEGALKGLGRGLTISKTKDCIYIKNFLKHQKNLPLNPEKNQAHKGIFKRFEVYKLKFEITDVFQFIEGASKGPQSPLGNGIGNDNGNKGGLGEKIDYDFIVGNYHSLCPKMNKVSVINDQRKGFINARVGEFGMDKVISVLRMSGESEFLNGKNDKAWKADFEWIMRPTNFVKILEGKYKNNSSGLAKAEYGTPGFKLENVR